MVEWISVVAIAVMLGALAWVVVRVRQIERQTELLAEDRAEALKQVEFSIGALTEKLAEVSKRLPEAGPVVTGRPPKLTDFGKEIADQTGAFSWAIITAPGLREHLKDEAGGYEADQLARKHVDYELSAEMRKTARNCAYEFGVEEHDVNLALRTVLRDELLKESS